MNSIKNKLGLSWTRLDSIKQIQETVVGLVEYKKDIDTYGKLDWWLWPKETQATKKGDCEDHALLMIAYAYLYLGQKCNLLIIKKYKDLKPVYHAIVEAEPDKESLVMTKVWVDSTSMKWNTQFSNDWQLVRRIPFWWIDWEIRVRRLWARVRRLFK